MTVAYPGTVGAFSHAACLRLVPDHRPLGVATFEDVIAAVERGDVDLGMLPLANNQAGETGARELIENANLRIVRETAVPIRMHLLGIPTATLEHIRTVVSHPIALRQCSRVLAALGANTEEASNTAIAAKTLTNPGRAVLASESAATLYGLAILKRDVQDREDNSTTFAIVARGLP